MKIAVICDRGDTLDVQQLQDNNPLQMMDLMAEAFTAGRKVVVFNIDNAGVLEERQYPKEPEPKGAATIKS